MEFRTKIPVTPQDPKIGFDSKILLLGSCFVENIGEKLEFYKFQTLQNPFGILFHPAAILNFLKRLQEQKIYGEEDIFHYNETWKCYEAHSDLNSREKEDILKKLNAGIQQTHEFLKEATHVVITPGTAWGYSLNETGKTVANCHKVPQKNFSKELMPVKNDIFGCLEVLEQLNPEIQVIFTVSPVRHLKDGFIENQRSKAALISAIHDLINKQKASRISYFPSYEIMIDELRDYRFYKEDMIHPNATAINYIWAKFKETWMTSETQKTMAEVEKIQKGLLHRPFNENSEAHQQFLQQLQLKMKVLQEKYPKMTF
ncbi:GSCFA domain-containing protein [Salinimicrobium sp. GXAS 041]|uniref:GSCFA domain-containing protein n=1 Tax=Salinimicrobium sp. GXAS 041 TaxID=3400806 RepID=UPI003C75767E